MYAPNIFLQLNPGIRDQMDFMIEKKYGGFDDLSANGLFLTYLMFSVRVSMLSHCSHVQNIQLYVFMFMYACDVQFQCCGLDGHRDFQNADKWKKRRNVTLGGRSQIVTLRTPIACCHYFGSLPYIRLSSPTCALTLNSSFHNNFGRV